MGSVGNVVTGPGNSGTWDWSHTPDDGPSDSQTVTITANNNTDPSNADTLAGFDWRFKDAQGGGYGPFGLVTPTEVSPATPFTLSATYADCGSHTATARARDKDSGKSNQPTVAVSVSDGDFHGAIAPAMRNMVQKGLRK